MSNNEMMKQKEKSVTYDYNGEQIELTMSQVEQFITRGGKKLETREIVNFMQMCKFMQLNPFLNEAYIIKFGNDPAQLIVSKDAFMKRAEKNEAFDGFEAGIIVQRGNEMVELDGAIKLKSDTLLGGWAKIYRKDRNRPITVKISVDEFGKSQATWRQMPANMIRKTAIVNALREAFPNNVGVMYTEEEANIEERKDITPAQEIIDKNANQIELDIQPEVIAEHSEASQKVVSQPTANKKEKVMESVQKEKTSLKEASEAEFVDIPETPPVQEYPDDLFDL